MTKVSHPPFWRTRRTLARLPLPTQLACATLCGALAVVVLHVLLLRPLRAPNPIAHAERQLRLGRPKPLVIVAAGLPRTGSTWVFNVLRILLRMRDPNSVAGWYADLINIWKNHKTHRWDHMRETWLDAYRSLNTSLLLKMHGPGPFRGFSHGSSLESSTDLTVITHRDLRTEVRSWVYQNWNASIHAGDISKTPFSNSEEWVRVAHHILTERKNTLESIGQGKAIDIRYEDWNDKPFPVQIKVIREMAIHLDWDFTNWELRYAAVEAARLEPPAQGAILMYNPVSKLHAGHTRVDASGSAFQAALHGGYKAIYEDPQCKAFLREKRYI